MKKYILSVLALTGCIVACENKDKTETKTDATSTGSVTLPYKASYTTDFTRDVPDADVLAALNFYKYWETGDMKALRSTLGDSATFVLYDGSTVKGSSDSLVKTFSLWRDSLRSVSIDMITWLKNHSIKDSANWVNVWYKEIDTYKNGKVDSSEFEDDNLMRNGKLAYYSSHRQPLK